MCQSYSAYIFESYNMKPKCVIYTKILTTLKKKFHLQFFSIYIYNIYYNTFNSIGAVKENFEDSLDIFSSSPSVAIL